MWIRNRFAILVQSLFVLCLFFHPASICVLAFQPPTECNRDCSDNGVCVIGKYETNMWTHYFEECECNEGWDGPYCDQVVTTCPDSHKCYHGSECVPGTEKNKTTGMTMYECDCSKAFNHSAFAGHMCEHPATMYCQDGVSVSRDTFCTNGGECKNNVTEEVAEENVEHHGCDCPDEFAGDHCEYLMGEAPTATPTATKSPNAVFQPPTECNLDLDCSDNGVCVVGKYETNMWTHYFEKCECNEGWDGPYCDQVVTTCPDSHKCYHGSECVAGTEKNKTTGMTMYECDCSKAFEHSAFAGHMCEHPATVYCQYGVSVSRDTFCTNGGKCKNIVVESAEENVEHHGCDCPDDFVGDHCEYLMGETPTATTTATKSSTMETAESTSSPKRYSQKTIENIILGVTLGFAVALGLAFTIHRKWKESQSMRNPRDVVDAGTDLDTHDVTTEVVSIEPSDSVVVSDDHGATNVEEKEIV